MALQIKGGEDPHATRGRKGIRTRVGPDIFLRLDANQGYRRAKRAARILGDDRRAADGGTAGRGPTRNEPVECDDRTSTLSPTRARGMRMTRWTSWQPLGGRNLDLSRQSGRDRPGPPRRGHRRNGRTSLRRERLARIGHRQCGQSAFCAGGGAGHAALRDPDHGARRPDIRPKSPAATTRTTRRRSLPGRGTAPSSRSTGLVSASQSILPSWSAIVKPEWDPVSLTQALVRLQGPSGGEPRWPTGRGERCAPRLRGCLPRRLRQRHRLRRAHRETAAAILFDAHMDVVPIMGRGRSSPSAAKSPTGAFSGEAPPT